MGKKKGSKSQAKGGTGGSGSSSKDSSVTIVVAAIAVAALAVVAYFVFSNGGEAQKPSSNVASKQKKSGGDGKYDRDYDYDPHDLSLFKVLGPQELKNFQKPTEHMKRAGSTVWGEARKKLLSNPNAIQIGINPEIFVIPNFLTDEECDEVLQLHEKRRAEATKTPKWCFSDNYMHLIPPDIKLEKGDGQDKCFRDNVELGQSIADQRERSNAFSRSVMVAQGEYDNTIVDTIGKRVDEAAMSEDNAYHTQILEYKQNEDYRVHTDCNNAANDRAATLLIYLKDTAEGGETSFPRQRVAVKPVKGTAVFFGSLDENGKCSRNADHAAAPVLQGGKTTIQRWYYEKNLNIPGGLEDHVLCDIGENCRWYMFWNKRQTAYKLEQKGIDFAEKKDAKNAEKYYKLAIEENKHQALSNSLYADILKNQGRLTEAVHHWEKALITAPGMEDALYLTGQSLQELRKPKEAQYYFKRLVKLNPRDADAWFLLGQCIMQELGQDMSRIETEDGQGLLKQAKRAFKKSIKIRPDDEASGYIKQISQKIK